MVHPSVFDLLLVSYSRTPFLLRKNSFHFSLSYFHGLCRQNVGGEEGTLSCHLSGWWIVINLPLHRGSKHQGRCDVHFVRYLVTHILGDYLYSPHWQLLALLWYPQCDYVAVIDSDGIRSPTKSRTAVTFLVSGLHSSLRKPVNMYKGW